MEEIIRHIHMEMLQAHCDAQSYIDDYMFLTERLENVFPENRNVKLEVFLMLYCEEVPSGCRSKALFSSAWSPM